MTALQHLYTHLGDKRDVELSNADLVDLVADEYGTGSGVVDGKAIALVDVDGVTVKFWAVSA